jgi:CHAT domain-containing protein/Flp pilus assembly protein TadD
MGSGRAIALAGLMVGLVGLAPVVAVPGVVQVVAQTADQRKAEGDRLLLQGIQQFQTSQFTPALQSWQQALLLYRAIKYREGEGAALGNLGNAYVALGNYAKAIELQQQSLAIAREIKDRQGEGAALGDLGNAYQSLGNYTKAIELQEQRLAIAREIKDRQGESQSLGNLGVAYFSLGNYAKAIEFQRQRLAIASEIKDLSGEGNVLTNLGNIYQALGNYSKAIEFQEKSLAISRKIKDRQGEGISLGNLGFSFYLLGNYAQAIINSEQSLAITRKIGDKRGERIALTNLGAAYQSLGNYAKALEYHEQSLALAREIRDRLGESHALGNLGLIYDTFGLYPTAITYQEQRLTIAREIKDRQGEGAALGNLGSIYSGLGNYPKAIDYLEQLLTIAREIKDRRGEGVALGNLGNAYESLGNYPKAIIYQEQSLAILREIKDQSGEGLTLNNLGLALFSAGDSAAAEKALRASIGVWEVLRQVATRNDAERVSIFERQSFTYRILQEVLIAQNKPKAALEIAERGRARAFVELLAKRLGRQEARVSDQSVIDPPNMQQIQQIARTQNAILVQYSIVAEGKEEDYPTTLYIWVIAPTGEITFRKADLKPLWQQQNTSLSKLVEQSRETMGARGRSDIEVALSPERLKQQQEQQGQKLKQLHQLLIEPIADLLPKDPTQRVIFMPQGELFLVPFPALLDANNKPLLEKHTILTAPSIQVLELTRQQRLTMQSSKLKVQNALVVGNPTMPKVVTRVGDEPMPLSDLPGAKREAVAIASLLNTQAVTGAQATKAAIAQQMPNARIIHLATHGLLDDTKGLGVPGAIALAPSGNGQLNDGLLTSDEILDMKLNAELVVLSACDTGRGRITGDGVIGLSRSLITAGVPSIVVSLWKVPDDATALLMTEFYKNLKRSPDKAQALRQAMLTTKQKYPDPLNWAAFTLIGEAE